MFVKQIVEHLRFVFHVQRTNGSTGLTIKILKLTVIHFLLLTKTPRKNWSSAQYIRLSYQFQLCKSKFYEEPQGSANSRSYNWTWVNLRAKIFKIEGDLPGSIFPIPFFQTARRRKILDPRFPRRGKADGGKKDKSTLKRKTSTRSEYRHEWINLWMKEKVRNSRRWVT